jgi:hypothetical protein
MKAISKLATGAAAAAMLTLAAAAPAEAQYRRHDRGVDTGDIITGIAVLGGIAAIASALDRDGSRYGYGYRDRYRDGYSNAVEACAREAQRIGRGRVQITDVDRTGNSRFRVRGVVRNDYGYGSGGYGRNDGYGRSDRYDRYDRYDRGDRYSGYGRDGREDFSCYANRSGRILDFNY